jgi:hypothetical protein
VFVASIVVTLLYLIWMRKRILQIALDLDLDAFTPSDFCLMGTNMAFDDYTPDAMEAKIKEIFKEKYNVEEEDVVYVNFSYKIQEFYKQTELYNDLNKKEAVVKAFCKIKEMEEEEYIALVEDPDNWPGDIPIAGGGMCGGKVIDLTEVRTQLEEVKAKIEELEKEAEEGAEDPERQQANFNGTCFVVLARPSLCLQVLTEARDGLFVQILKSIFGCCLPNHMQWTWERAPEPNDIFWENLGVSSIERIVSGFLSFFATVILIGACFGLITAIKIGQENYMKNQEGKELSFQEQGLSKVISVGASVIVTVVNSSLVYIIRRFSMSEQHETITKMNVSVAIKLTIARFINSSAILVAVNRNAKEWFDGGNMVYDASILIILMTFQLPTMYVFNIPGIMKWIKVSREKGKGEDCTLTQREANLLCEGPAVDVANNIANVMNYIMTCMFYAPIIPQTIPLAFIGCFLNYWAYKYMLLRRHKMPEMFSDLMAVFFSNFMPWIVLSQCIAYFVFMNKIKEGYPNLVESLENAAAEYKAPLSDQTLQTPLIALIIVGVCLVSPIRWVINKCINADKALENDKEYTELINAFPTDYDKENPLTIKKGQLRLLELQLEKAKKDGDEETIKMLEAQKGNVN